MTTITARIRDSFGYVESYKHIDAATYPAAARAAAKWFRGALGPEEMGHITKTRHPNGNYAIWEWDAATFERPAR